MSSPLDPLPPEPKPVPDALVSFAKGLGVSAVGAVLATAVLLYKPEWLGPLAGPFLGAVLANAYNAFRQWAMANGYKLPF